MRDLLARVYFIPGGASMRGGWFVGGVTCRMWSDPDWGQTSLLLSAAVAASISSVKGRGVAKRRSNITGGLGAEPPESQGVWETQPPSRGYGGRSPPG